MNPREAERKEAVFSILVNLLIFAMRLIAGLMIRSSALIADSVHGLSDSITSIGVLASSKIAAKPADREHPFGHGKAADLGSLLIGVVLFIIGGLFFLNGIDALLSPSPLNTDFFVEAIAVTLLTVAIKYYNYMYAKNLATLGKSNLCMADALHHKLDALITLGASVGITIEALTGISRLDGILTIIISAFVLYEGGELITKILGPLMDRNVEDVAERVRSLALSVNGVRDVVDVKVRESGGEFLIELVLKMDGGIPLTEAHAVTEKVEMEIREKIPRVIEVHIHEEPSV
ncbi:MAG: cation diffusion facilitator family transporter [Fervidicoccaceae archaeon]